MTPTPDTTIAAQIETLAGRINEPAPKALPEQDTRVGEAMAGIADDRARKLWQERVRIAQTELTGLLPAIVTALRQAEGAGAQQTIQDALMDSQYLAGAKAGWNAAQSDDPEAAFAALQKSREGHLAGFVEAKASFRQAEAAPGVVEAVKVEIERQCSIGAGTCQRDPETGLIEVHADIDANGFAAAMTEALARQHGAREDAAPSADAAMVEVLLRALMDVCDPIAAMQRDCPDGHELNHAAVTIGKSLQFVQAKARAALDLASRQPAGVPEGFVLVPREPTEAMIEAGVRAGVRAAPEPWCPKVWSAMIAAAPATGEREACTDSDIHDALRHGFGDKIADEVMSDETVETVARAIYEEDDPWHKAWPWPDLNPEAQGGVATAERYRSVARAAINAFKNGAI